MSEAGFLAGVYTVCIGAMTVVQVLYPKINRRNVVLGVVLPSQALEEEDLKGIVRSYQWTTGVASLAAGSFFVWWTWTNPAKIGWQMASFLALLLLQFLVFLFFHGKIRDWKKEHHYALKETKVVVNLELSRDKIQRGGFPWLLYLPGGLMILMSAIYLVWAWPSLPQQIPTHWSFQGEADAYGEKNIFNVFTTPLINVFLLGVIMFAHYSLLRMKQQLNPQHTQESLRALQISRRYWNGFFFLTTTGFVGIVSLGALMTTGVVEDSKWLLAGTLGMTLWSVIGSLWIGLKVGNSGERLKKESLHGDAAMEDDDKWILGGTIYYNPGDPAIFVPKRVGIGSTINLGTTFGKVLMAILLLMILWSTAVAFLGMGNGR